MEVMVVTLDMSKLSGWLNADALCPQSEGGHRMRDKVRAGRVGGASAVQAACMGASGLSKGWVRRGAAHGKHGEHVPDPGRVEAQQLVER